MADTAHAGWAQARSEEAQRALYIDAEAVRVGRYAAQAHDSSFA